ncbi:MAG: glycosyltransferase family 2 protein [Gammaproteobacteria bacterium]|nr:glycosyltransferase family 2 protein [Gammaproteobacteria bacterium]
MKSFVIPMAGRGSRFQAEGHRVPKFLIEVKGRTLFEHALHSLPLHLADRLIFVCLDEHREHDVETFIRSRISHPDIRVLFLEALTRGQAETVLRAEPHLSADSELLVYNIDTRFASATLADRLRGALPKHDGIIGAFTDTSPDDKWSFARVDDAGLVIRTTEKEKISDHALTGLYHFSRAGAFFEVARQWIAAGRTVRNELYIAPMYNDLIERGGRFVLDTVNEFIPLGTPDEVRRFEHA